mgnify:CR=1 FL=1
MKVCNYSNWHRTANITKYPFVSNALNNTNVPWSSRPELEKLPSVSFAEASEQPTIPETPAEKENFKERKSKRGEYNKRRLIWRKTGESPHKSRQLGLLGILIKCSHEIRKGLFARAASCLEHPKISSQEKGSQCSGTNDDGSGNCCTAGIDGRVNAFPLIFTETHKQGKEIYC